MQLCLAEMQGVSFAYLTPCFSIIANTKATGKWNDDPSGVDHERFLVRVLLSLGSQPSSVGPLELANLFVAPGALRNVRSTPSHQALKVLIHGEQTKESLLPTHFATPKWCTTSTDHLLQAFMYTLCTAPAQKRR